jgi:hypothetical protein
MKRQAEFLNSEKASFLSLLREPGGKGGGSSDGSKLCLKVLKRGVEVQLKK